MPWFRLFRSFILRALWREKLRSLVAMLGIALGVAVMLAIRLANSTVTETFKAAVDSVSGQASVRIRGTAGRFDETWLTRLTWLDDYGQSSPVVEAFAMLDQLPGPGASRNAFPRGELLYVLGVDVLLDFPMRDYHVLHLSEDNADQKSTAIQALRLLDDTESIILTEKFLRRHELRVGDTVPLTFGTTSRNYTIRGVLLDRGPARTLDGNFALMDIAAAQISAERLGIIDYVDLLLPTNRRPESEMQEINARLPEGLVAELPDADAGRADTMVAAFQFNLTALSGVALIVGLFLIYNTVSISVAARRSEVGMLQAIGAGRMTILGLFLGEALLLAAAGVLMGIPLGSLLARGAIAATAQTVEIFYIANVAQASAASLVATWTDRLVVAVVTLPLALIAALIPAWEAASVPPVDAVRRPSSGLSLKTLWRLTILACGVSFCGWMLTHAPPLNGRPIWGFAAEMTFMAAAAIFTPVALTMMGQLAMRLSRSIGRRTCGYELRLAVANLEGGIGRVSISVAALAMSLSMMVAIAVMVGSFRETVTYWLDSALTSDLAVKPVMTTSSVSEERISRFAVETISNDPEVVDTVWFSSRQLPYQDRQVRLAVTEIDKTLRHSHLLFKGPGADRQLSTGDVLVSESFANLFQVALGDAIELPTAGKPASLRVAGVYYDYASNQGTILMDLADYQRLYGATDPNLAPQHLSIHLAAGADPEVVRQRLVQAVGEQERIYCVTNREVRQEALRIFESTFTITYALQLIAIFVAGMGVAATLITMIYHRRRDIGLLSLNGATQSQLKRIFVFEAVLLGISSQLLGIVVGLVLALVLIYVINVQSFGWTIQMHLPVAFLLQSSVLVVGAAAMFGLYPAIQAASIDALDTVREEHA